jgi:flagellar biosynthesis protein FlhG
MYEFSKLKDGWLMAHIWPIGGGKGGSGKSFLASSLGRLLSKSGKKTLLIDLDLGAANLHTMVNVPYPEKCFSDFVTKKIPDLDDTVLATPFPNLFLISGAHDNLDIANLPFEKKLKTLKAIAKLRNGIFITTPEPTSIENVYRLMRAIYLRRIRHYFSTADFKALEKKVRQHMGDDSFYKPEHIVSVVKKEYPEKYALIKKDFSSFYFKLILNQLRKQDNADLGEQICKIIKKHLGINVEFSGNIAYDEHVHDAICQRVCFLDRYPHTRAANDLRVLNRKMGNAFGEQLMLNYL